MAAGHVRALLRGLGRDEEVIGWNDAWQVGPLHRIDRGGDDRARFWRTLSEGVPDLTPASFDDTAVWARLRDDVRSVIVWHGPHPAERLLMLRTCHALRAHPRRLWEVALPYVRGRSLPRFYGAVALNGDKLLAAWPKRTRIRDVHRRAATWRSITDRPGDWLRELRHDRVVHRPLDVHDGALVAATRGRWIAVARVIGHVLVDAPLSDLFLNWRIRQLLASGALVGRGWHERFGLPAELAPPGLADDAP